MKIENKIQQILEANTYNIEAEKSDVQLFWDNMLIISEQKSTSDAVSTEDQRLYGYLNRIIKGMMKAKQAKELDISLALSGLSTIALAGISSVDVLFKKNALAIITTAISKL